MTMTTPLPMMPSLIAVLVPPILFVAAVALPWLLA